MTAPDLPGGALASFREIAGDAHVLTDPDMTAGYVRDWTGRFVGATPAVVRPATTSEVAAIVGVCRRLGVALTLQGGNTGLVGGGVPLEGEVVLSLARLGEVGGADSAAGQLTAGAGATVGAVQRAAASAGWAYAVDLASRDSATVGGTVATNAGGLRVLRYGDTRAQLAGIEAVLGTGEVVSHLGGLLKDNTGYHLPGLLCGSEGTLGVVTRARLRLVAPVRERAVALLAFDGDAAASAAAAIAAGQHLRRSLRTLEAAEVFFGDGMELVCSVIGLAPPFDRIHAAYLLVEAGGDTDPTDELAGALTGALAGAGGGGGGGGGGLADVAVAGDPARRAALWRYREAHTEAISTLGPVHKLDVTLPADNLAHFAETVAGRVAGRVRGAKVWRFGHVADGNIHVNVTGVAAGDERVDDEVLGYAAELGGSISAEHGIGVAKRRWLSLSRSPAEIATFRTLKAALDPDGVLNPAVLLPRAAPGNGPSPP